MPVKRRIIKKAIKRAKAAPAVLTPERREKIEQEKRLAMYAGVGFFMVVIMVIWALNFKSNVRAVSQPTDNSSREFEQITADFQAVIADTKKNMAELKQALNTSGQVAAVKLPAEMEQRIELEKLLFSLNDKLAEATSTSENK